MILKEVDHPPNFFAAEAQDSACSSGCNNSEVPTMAWDANQNEELALVAAQLTHLWWEPSMNLIEMIPTVTFQVD